MFKEIKNPRFLKGGKIQVDVLLTGDESGEFLPFIADKNDIEEHGRKLFEELLNGEYGEVEEYAPPTEAEELEKQILFCLQLRKDSYKAESDPLYLEWQFSKEAGTAEEAEAARIAWIEKVKEIKERFPKPE